MVCESYDLCHSLILFPSLGVAVFKKNKCHETLPSHGTQKKCTFCFLSHNVNLGNMGSLI